MEGLIEALQIFLKYKNEANPTHCEHDVLLIMGVTKEEVSDEDSKRLEELGFNYGDPIGDCECWYSFLYGSA